MSHRFNPKKYLLLSVAVVALLALVVAPVSAAKVGCVPGMLDS